MRRIKLPAMASTLTLVLLASYTAAIAYGQATVTPSTLQVKKMSWCHTHYGKLCKVPCRAIPDCKVCHQVKYFTNGHGRHLLDDGHQANNDVQTSTHKHYWYKWVCDMCSPGTVLAANKGTCQPIPKPSPSPSPSPSPDSNNPQCGVPFTFADQASKDGEEFVFNLTAPTTTTALKVRWDMYVNPDRLQIYAKDGDKRGNLLLDTGYVGKKFGCGRSDPLNPDVIVTPPSVCASQDGCFGLTGEARDEEPELTMPCPTVNAPGCHIGNFGLASQFQIVVTSGCSGSAFDLKIDCE